MIEFLQPSEPSPITVRKSCALNPEKNLEVIIWTRRKQIWQLSRSFFSTNSQKCLENLFWKRIRQTIRKEFWQTCSKLPAQNPKIFCKSPKILVGSVHLDTFNAALETLVKLFTQSQKKVYSKNGTSFKHFFRHITPAYSWNGTLASLTKPFLQSPKIMPAHSKNFLNILFLWTSTMQVPQSTGNFNSNTAFFEKIHSRMWFRTSDLQF